MKNNAQILVGKAFLFFWFVGIALMVFWVLLTSFILLRGDKNTLKTVVCSLCLIAGISVFVTATIICNRGCNRICFDGKTFVRKGFLFGYFTSIELNTIKRIEKVSIHLDGKYYVLVDDSHIAIERLRKNSSIFIPVSEKGLKFIRLCKLENLMIN